MNPLDYVMGVEDRNLNFYKQDGTQMNGEEIIEIGRGLIQGAKSSGMVPPFRILVPHDTNLQEVWEGENMSLEERLKDITDVKEVKVTKGRGVSIESIGAEDEVKKTSGY